MVIRTRNKRRALVTITVLTVLIACWASVLCLRPAFLFDIHAFPHPERITFRGHPVQSFGSIKGTRQSSATLRGEYHFEFSGLCYIQVRIGSQSKYFWGHRLVADGRPNGADISFQ